MEFNYGYYEYIDINKPYALFNYQIAGISLLLPSAAVLILIHYTYLCFTISYIINIIP